MKIEKIKKTGNKYKLILEDKSQITTYDDVIIKNNLLFNPDVDSEVLNKINIDTEYFDIYYKTINYITRKLRSEKEVNDFIDKYEVDNKNKQEIIKKLKEIGLLNDINFVKAYISDKIYLSTSGPNKIKADLLQHDISETVINIELDKIDDTIIIDKLTKLITKKIKTNTKYAGYYLKQKIVGELTNLGYETNKIIEIYDSLKIETDDLIIKEYNKLYKKLSVKYTDKELKLKIKQKLYKLGFTIDEINKVLD